MIADDDWIANTRRAHGRAPRIHPVELAIAAATVALPLIAALAALLRLIL